MTATPRCRFTRQRQRSRLVIGERDSELLAEIYYHRAMSRSQVQELYFGSVARCNSRLRQLFDHGYLSRHYPSAARYGAEAVYTLGPAGIPVVAGSTGLDPAEVRRQCGRPTYMEHTLEVVEFYLAARRASASSGTVAIERWLPEIRCRHEYRIRLKGQSQWAKEVFKPDGFVRLTRTRGGATEDFSYFIEIDLGHTSSRQFGRKIDSYSRYRDTGMFTERYSSSAFQTLVITTGQARLRNLVTLAEDCGAADMRITTLSDAKAPPDATVGNTGGLGVLGAVWWRPFGVGPERLL